MCFPGAVLGSVMFNIFNGVDDGIECSLSRFTDDVKSEEMGCAAIQRELSKLEK